MNIVQNKICGVFVLFFSVLNLGTVESERVSRGIASPFFCVALLFKEPGIMLVLS